MTPLAQPPWPHDVASPGFALLLMASRSTQASAPIITAKREARSAGLIYVSDEQPGLRRQRSGKGFIYFDARGRRVTNEKTLQRIRSLAIPPAYTQVWICSTPRGHIQATGRDAKGRKQYRYHPRWREVRDAGKFDRMQAFGKALPRIRRRVTADLKSRRLSPCRVLAALVRLLDATLLRVGNEDYASDNGSYGLTTLRNRHVKVSRQHVRLRFRGKSGIERDLDIDEPIVARLVARLQELPGQHVFQYLDDQGVPHPVDSGMVNDYLRDISGANFTAKDFRTWGATVLATAALGVTDIAQDATERARRAQMKTSVEAVARQLGHTPTVCRQSYIHPAIFAACESGTLQHATRQLTRRSRATVEKLTLRLLKLHAAAAGRRARRLSPKKHKAADAS